MIAPTMPKAEFIESFNAIGPYAMARQYGLSLRSVFKRRHRLEELGHKFIPRGNGALTRPTPATYPHRIALDVKNGIVLVASDAHYWPETPSLLHQALVRFCKDYKPIAIVFNGDVIDAPSISKHPQIGWETRPKLVDEIEASKDRLAEIEKAAFRAQKIWNLGNHDLRFETRLAHVAPEYAKIHGVHLKDHFPLWRGAWSTWVNDAVVIKHRFKGGIHAPHNNTLWAGKSIVTGHLHSAKVVPFSDYNGTRYGVDGGCIADTDAKAFVDYTEDNPKNWASAFCVLTFKDRLLLQPELVLKFDHKRVQFRGEVITP